jgi:hypothetical protein
METDRSPRLPARSDQPPRDHATGLDPLLPGVETPEALLERLAESAVDEESEAERAAVMPTLRLLLDHAAGEVAYEATRQFFRRLRAADSDTVATLTPLLKHRRATVRSHAASELILELPDPAAAEALCAAMTDRTVLNVIGGDLLDRGSPGDERLSLVPGLYRALAEGDEASRAAAISILTDLGRDTLRPVVPAIASCLIVADSVLSRVASFALSQAEPADLVPVVPQVVAALADAGPEVARHLLFALREVGPAARSAGPAVTRFLDPAFTGELRLGAADCLAKIGFGAPAVAFYREWSKAGHPSAAAWMLSQIVPEGRAALREDLSHPSAEFRRTAAEALAPHEAETVAPFVREMMVSRRAEDRRWAVERFRRSEPLTRLLSAELVAMTADTEPEIRAGAWTAI